MVEVLPKKIYLNNTDYNANRKTQKCKIAK